MTRGMYGNGVTST